MALELKPATTTGAPAPIEKPSALDFLTRRKIDARDRRFFTEQLALLLETGTQLHSALEALARQAQNPAMRQVIEDLMDSVASGQSFSHALSMHPEIFSSTYVNLIGASESGGFMHEVLNQLLQEEAKREQLRNTLVSSMTYPMFLIGFSILVVVFVLVFVFPKFSDMFAKIEDQLPATTITLMWMSDLLRLYWVQTLVGAATSLFVIYRWVTSTTGAAVVDKWKLSLPGLRSIFVELYLIQTLRIMSLSLMHGVSVVDTLASCRDVISNRLFRRFLTNIETGVQEGSTLASGFESEKFVPDLVKQMITTGEQSGNVGKVMGRIADHYEQGLSKRLVALSKMAEPVMLLVMGVLVGLIVSSLILPIFKLSKAVG